MKKIKSILKNNAGQIGIEICIMIVFSMMIILLAINAFSIVIQKQTLDYFAQEMVKTASFYGDTNHEKVLECYERLKVETGLEPSYTFTPSGKVQLGNPITIKLQLTVYLKATGSTDVPIELESTQSDLSRQYIYAE